MADKLAKRQAVAEALEKAAAKRGVTVAELVAGMLAKEPSRTPARSRRPGGRLSTGLEGAEDWAEEERRPGGVLSRGGMRGGGIFGDAPVATSFHDPVAEEQERRVGDADEVRRLVRRLHDRLDDAEADGVEEALAGLLGDGEDDD